MTDERAKITGVVLAGGRGSRMGGVDKGLLLLHGRPLVSYALEALSQVAGERLISANRHLDRYAEFGCPVISDLGAGFEGPLAGLLSAMRHAQTPYVMMIPCDSPLMTGALLWRLYERLQAEHAEVCAAHDGDRLQPAFLIAERGLAPSLADYLASGQRKLALWLQQHRLALADFSDQPRALSNINTPDELAALESSPDTAPQTG